MADDLDYPRLVREALRTVPRAVLTEVAASGLAGDHSLYLTFDTTAPGVEMPPPLRAIYPQEMTIVLERQFWELTVTDEGFAVTLSFGGRRQRLTVPFAALTGFADPPAEFGLRFAPSPEENGTDAKPAQPDGALPQAPAAPTPAAGGAVVPFERKRKR